MASESDRKKDPRAWDALTPPLAEWILDAMAVTGFERMTPVQASTIPLFIKNKDVVVEVQFVRGRKSSLLTCKGCHGQWKDIGLLDTYCGEAIAIGRAH